VTEFEEEVQMLSRLPFIDYVIVAVSLLLLLPCRAGAQQPAHAFSTLSQWIKPGDAVTLTDAKGRLVKGKVTDLSPSSITLTTSNSANGAGNAGETQLDNRLTFPEQTVRRIVRRHSLWSGALAGAGVAYVGAGPGLFFVEGKKGLAVSLAAGVALGAVIDALNGHTVYESTQHSSVALSPVSRMGKRGVRPFLSFLSESALGSHHQR
jgi:hypothetical protein